MIVQFFSLLLFLFLLEHLQKSDTTWPYLVASEDPTDQKLQHKVQKCAQKVNMEYWMVHSRKQVYLRIMGSFTELSLTYLQTYHQTNEEAHRSSKQLSHVDL